MKKLARLRAKPVKKVAAVKKEEKVVAPKKQNNIKDYREGKTKAVGKGYAAKYSRDLAVRQKRSSLA